MKFKTIEERIKFYKKYLGYGVEPWKLRDKDYKLYYEYSCYDHKYNWTNGSSREHDVYYFMKWLFEYCSGDIKVN